MNKTTTNTVNKPATNNTATTGKKSAKNNNKVNTATLTPIGVSALSDFHKASFELAKLQKAFVEEKKAATAALEKAKESRAKNASVSIAKELGKLDAIQKKYKDDCAPFRKKQSDVCKMIDDNFYYGYKIAMAKGDARATGKVSITRGEKTTIYTVTSKDCFLEYIKTFLDTLGVSNLDNTLAIDKVAKLLVLRCSGRMADRSTGFTKDRNMSSQKDLFIRSVIQYLVEDRHALVMNEDWTLCKKSNVKTEA